MDVITLIAVTNSGIQVAQELRKSLKARDAIYALHNELTDLKCVLTTAQSKPDHPSLELTIHLSNIYRRTEKCLSGLEKIIKTRVLKQSSGHGELVVDHIAWFLNRARVEAHQKELRNLRSALSLALATLTSSGVGRVGLAVTALTTLTNQNVDSNKANLDQVPQTLRALELQRTGLRALVEQRNRPDTESLVTVSDDESSCTMLVATSDVQDYKQDYILIRAKVCPSSSGCDGPCTCVCHAQRRGRTPAVLDNFFGTLFSGYIGQSMSRWQCNVQSCSNRRQQVTAHFTYYFPQWFVQKAIIATMRFSKSSTPEFGLKVARVVPDTAPVFQLARAGNIQGVKYLFENHLASPFDIGGGLGASTPHYAVDRPGNFEMTRFLMSCGADFDVQDKTQKTAADRIWNRIFGDGCVDKSSFIEILGSLSRTEQLERRTFTHLHNLVLKEVPGDLESELKTKSGSRLIDQMDADGITALTWAARRGDYQAVEVLLRYGADASVPSHAGATALYYAGCSFSPEAPAVIRALLKAGAPVNACTFRGESPLHICVMYHDDPDNFIAPLVEYGADIKSRDRKGISVLDLAIQSDHMYSVGYLLDAGVKLDTVGDANITGLSVAIIYNSHRVLQLLMDRGADSSIVSKEQKTLLHLSAAYADCRTLDILAGYGLDIDRSVKDCNADTAEDIFARRNDKDADLTASFEALLESLGSGSVIFAELDPKDLSIMTHFTYESDSQTSEDFYDANESVSSQDEKKQFVQ